MVYKIKTEKTLQTDNGKQFGVGSDIAFILKTNNKHYIGNIKEIYNNCMILNDLVLNNRDINGRLTVYYDDILPNSCSYVSVD